MPLPTRNGIDFSSPCGGRVCLRGFRKNAWERASVSGIPREASSQVRHTRKAHKLTPFI